MKNIYSLVCLLLVIAFFSACKTDKNDNSQLAIMEAALSATPNVENANNYIKEINKEVATNNEGLFNNKALLEKGLSISKEYKLTNQSSRFLTSLLRADKTDAKKAEYIYDLAGIMRATNNRNAANTLFKAFVDLFPSDDKTETIKKTLGDLANQDIHAYLKILAESIFVNPNQFGINEAASLQYVNACEAYALSYSDERAPEYLYKAAEIARSLRTFPKTLGLYDWIIDSYPNYKKAPTTLFLKGFVLENELNNIDAATKTYKDFIEKYPSHELADDVQFLLDNIGKSNEEILKIIEQNKKDREAKENQ